MEIDWPYYSAIIFFSCVGFVYFAYGKKMKEFWFMIAGLSLMFYGYTIDSWVVASLVGLVLSAIPFLTRYI